MTAYPALFMPLIDVIMVQLHFLGASAFTPQSATTYGAHYLAEDLVDTGIAPLVEKGRVFEKFLCANL